MTSTAKANEIFDELNDSQPSEANQSRRSTKRKDVNRDRQLAKASDAIQSEIQARQQKFVESANLASEAQYQLGAKEAQTDLAKQEQGYQLQMLQGMTQNRVARVESLIKGQQAINDYVDQSSSERIAGFITQLQDADQTDEFTVRVEEQLGISGTGGNDNFFGLPSAG